MGGNVFKDKPTKRLEKDNYFKLTSYVIEILSNMMNIDDIYLLPTYLSKESFGDADVLIKRSEKINKTSFTELLKQTLQLNSDDFSNNGDCLSVRISEFQFDFIFTNGEEWETMKVYHGNGDLGNLMGRVSHKMGFKYGHSGLNLILRDGDYQFAELNVSRDSEKIFEFLGYDFNRYLQGFKSLNDIFEFVASTKYFNKEIYLLQNRNHTSRVRDKKRKTYNEFLTWAGLKEFENNYQWLSYEERGGTKVVQEHLDRAFEMFPAFKAEYDTMVIAFEKSVKFKQLFNGDLVREWTGLQDQELGKFMKMLKEFTKVTWTKPFEEWVIENPELVERFVVNYFKSLRE